MAATSARNSGLAPPYFTRIVSPPGSSQSNLGDVPPTFFGRNRQVTSAPVSKPPGPWGLPARFARATATAGVRQTRAERSACVSETGGALLVGVADPESALSLFRRLTRWTAAPGERQRRDQHHEDELTIAVHARR